MFVDRTDAGRQLAGKLTHLRGQNVVVLGLPRGGVPVAVHVAEQLQAPLDVIVVRKLGVPWQPELAMGAIGEGGVRVVNPHVLEAAGVGQRDLTEVEEVERPVLARRVAALRGNLPPATLAGRTAVIVDDGVATGATARVACQVARARGAARIVLAAPVVPRDLIGFLRQNADEVVCVTAPEWLSAIGEWYEDFSPTSDQEVRDLLTRAVTRSAGTAGVGLDDEVTIRLGQLALPGRLMLPAGAPGLVVFAHGSGSSRHSTRNRHVASVLNDAGLGTLLFDLLTPEEERDRARVFDIPLLAARLAGTTAWVRDQSWGGEVAIGWFGASTGAGAALWAAGEPHADVAAIVSRGGRPDLAEPRLPAVTAPTLLIVGSLDSVVLDLNRYAQSLLGGPNELVEVPGATHLFEEPGTLAVAAAHAREWFTRFLVRAARPSVHSGTQGQG